MKFTKEDIRSYGIIALGSIVLAAALHFFLIPGKLAAGGVSGLSIILSNVFPVLSTATYVLILNIILFCVGFIVLGKAFGSKTIFSSAVLTGALYVFEIVAPKIMLTDDILINTFFGTLVSAGAMSLVFNENASTGGTDIVAKIVNKYLHIEIGKALLIVDFIVTALGFATFGPRIGFYSLIAVLLNGTMIDRMILGYKSAKEIFIMSKEEEAIREFILTKLDRGCTLLKGKGGYTGNEVKVIYVVLNRQDFIHLRTYIKSIDTKAFISVNEVHEVFGEGYDDITVL